MSDSQKTLQEEVIEQVKVLRKLYVQYAIDWFGAELPEEDRRKLYTEKADEITYLVKYCASAALMRSGLNSYYNSQEFIERVMPDIALPIQVYIYNVVRKEPNFNVDTYFELTEVEGGYSLNWKGSDEKHFNLATSVLDKLVGPVLAQMAVVNDEEIDKKICNSIVYISTKIAELNNANNEIEVDLSYVEQATREAFDLIFTDEFEAAKEYIHKMKADKKNIEEESMSAETKPAETEPAETDSEIENKLNEMLKEIEEEVNSVGNLYAQMGCKLVEARKGARLAEEEVKGIVSYYGNNAVYLIKYLASTSLMKAGIGNFGKAVFYVDKVIGANPLVVYIYDTLLKTEGVDVTSIYGKKSSSQGVSIQFLGNDEEHFDIVTKVIDNVTGPMLAELIARERGELVDQFVKILYDITMKTGVVINNIFDLEYDIVLEKVEEYFRSALDQVFGDEYVATRNKLGKMQYTRFVENTLEGSFLERFPDGHITELKINVPSENLLNIKKLMETCSSRNEAIHKYESAVVLLECVGTFYDPATGTSSQGSAKGSGLIISRDGYVLTCAHCVGDLLGFTYKEKDEKFVIGDKMYVRVAHPDKMEEAKVYKAGIISVWPAYDMAIIKIQDGDNNFPYVEIDLEKDSVDDLTKIAVIGFPHGNQRENVMNVTPSITEGGVMRRATNTDGAMTEFPVAQHTAAAYHGNSGGPVVNLETGKVVGLLEGAKLFEDDTEINHFFLLEYGKDFIENFNIRVFGSDEEKAAIKKYFKN